MLLFRISSGVFKRVNLLFLSCCIPHMTGSPCWINIWKSCVFFLFQKGFDTVSHRKLMNILCEIGTHPVLLSWLCSYLSGRQQHVLVSGMHSECCHVLSGVPQGSVLGPLLFLIYINSLTYIPLSDSTMLTLYADDLLINKPILTESSHVQLQGDINSISLWAVTIL